MISWWSPLPSFEHLEKWRAVRDNVENWKRVNRWEQAPASRVSSRTGRLCHEVALEKNTPGIPGMTKSGCRRISWRVFFSFTLIHLPEPFPDELVKEKNYPIIYMLYYMTTWSKVKTCGRKLIETEIKTWVAIPKHDLWNPLIRESYHNIMHTAIKYITIVYSGQR